ncbi:LD-carboxypeptidase [Bacillus sp. 165]|uniref:S66 peptidase family protein n=1 Tax=Bacillus sp. 165 TaxID=1529117 RepID=UPI001AD9AE25|nr:LD-carboxypeptidase [Bacillus sp. 165]MBO9129190.1 LD-carboxypeptidase [Bacillus sp. 165]
MIKPVRLQQGNTVMILAPASPPKVEQVEKMKRKLEDMGLHVKMGKSVYEKHAYLSGSDSIRLHDFHEAFADKNVQGIFCARGGYGSGRLLDSIDFQLIKDNPKIFWGYSDITALHIAMQKHANLVTFHGPMMEECGADTIKQETIASIAQLFEPREQIFQAADTCYPSFSNRVKGEMVGGNLTVLTSTLGTPYEIDVKGKILFIEDIGEEPYRIDRMLNQLRLAGKFEECKGVILGDFNDCGPKKRTDSLTIQEVVYDHIVPYQVPILSGFLIGHCKPNYGVPFGVLVMMNGADRTLIFEAGVR